MTYVNSILKQAVCGLKLLPFMLVLSTVFVVDNNLANGIVAGKYFWFYVSLGVVSVTVILSFFSGNKNIRIGRVDGLVFLFWLSGIMVNCFLQSPTSDKQVTLYLLLPLYLYFRFILSENYRLNGFILLFFLQVTGFVEAVWGLGQLYGYWPSQHGHFKITGSFFNPGPYAGYLGMILPVACYYSVSDYRVWERKPNRHYLPFYSRWILSVLTGTAILLILPAAMSRAAWIAAIGGSLVGIVFTQKQQAKILFRKYRKLIFGIGPLVLLLSAGMYYLKKDSADGRMLIWKISIQTAVKHPFGAGLGNFAGCYGEEQAAYFAAGKGSEQEKWVAGNPEYAFNEYFQVCIEYGVIPFLLFIAILFMGLKTGIRNRKYATVGSLTALLIFAVLSYPFNVLPFVIVLILLLTLCVTELQPKVLRILKYKFFVGGIWIILLLITGYYLYNRYPGYKAYKEWNYSRILYSLKLYKNTEEEYVKLYPKFHCEIQFLFEYARILTQNKKFEESNGVLKQAMKVSCDPMLYNMAGINCQKLKKYKEAETYFLKASYLVPNRLYPYYLLAKLYKEIGQMEKAEKMAGMVLTKKPKVDSQAVSKMREEMNTY